ncbi:MAG: PHP domain-containing protein, partial [Acidimicrobiia bacterium]
LLGRSLAIAEEMVSLLLEVKSVHRVEYAGSLRRMKETIGDIDLLAASSEATLVMDAFSSLPGVIRVVARGSTKSTVVTRHGVQVDIRVVAPGEFGAALQYFTGSKEHNVKVREHAVKQGYKLSEYGLHRVKGSKLVAAETEEEVYSALGMQTPPPTIREDRGEVELALRGELPVLVELSDVKGDLQGHSTYSDGRLPIRKMAEAAAERGLKYWAVTDHGRGLSVVKHLEVADIDRQADEVAKVNAALEGKITVLHGVELNIGPEGELDYPDEILAKFDFVLASVHSPPWEKERMTKRLIRAIENPHVDVIGHPAGRRIGRRPGGEFDAVAVFKAAAKQRVAMEVNSNEQRLDLRDDHVRVANDLGCLFAISTDAHRVSDLAYLRLGVFTAQRGWVQKESVINTWPLSKLQKFVGERRNANR